MAGLPEGTVTLLFTDIEGSTLLVQKLGDRYGEALATQRALLRSAVQAAGGHEIDTQGDSFFIAFATVRDALEAAVAAQRALAGEEWPADAEVRLRERSWSRFELPLVISGSRSSGLGIAAFTAPLTSMSFRSTTRSARRSEGSSRRLTRRRNSAAR